MSPEGAESDHALNIVDKVMHVEKAKMGSINFFLLLIEKNKQRMG